MNPIKQGFEMLIVWVWVIADRIFGKHKQDDNDN